MSRKLSFGLGVVVVVVLVFSSSAVEAVDLGNVMVLGDSITQANSEHNSYRYELWKSLIDDGGSFDLVGSIDYNYGGDPARPTYKGLSFDQDHEGHWGWRAFDILDGKSGGASGSGSLSQWLDNSTGGYTPDTALLLIGTNDLSSNNLPDHDNAPVVVRDRIGSIIDTLQADNPNVQVYLGEIIPRNGTDYDTEIGDLNALLPTLASNKTTASSNVTVVQHNATLNTTDHTYDGTHPNAAGEAVIAQNWAAALGLQDKVNRGQLNIINHSFEENVLNSGSIHTGTVRGWSKSSGSNGVVNFTGDTPWYPEPPSAGGVAGSPIGNDGVNTAYLYENANTAFIQQLAGADEIAGNVDDPVLKANTIYKVEVGIGNRNRTSNAGNVGWGGYDIQLQANGTVIAQSRETTNNPAADGYMVDVAAYGVAHVGHAQVDQMLTLSIGKPGGSGEYLDFDNVRVTAYEATTLNVINASFETPSNDPGILKNVGAGGSFSHPGWTFTGFTNAGSFTPDAYTDFYKPLGDGLDGTHCAYLYSGSGVSSISQTLAGADAVLGNADDPTLAANSIYALTIAFGNRNGDSTTPFGGFIMELLAGDEVIASRTRTDEEGGLGEAGDFTDVSLLAEIGADHAQLGEALTIRVTRYVQDGSAWVDFDNVRFAVASVPEPSTFVLSILALATLGFIWRRRSG